MKILYDSQIFELQKYGGISRYFVELMSAYNDDKGMDITLSAKISDNEYLLKNNICKNWTFPAKYIIKKRNQIQKKVNRLFLKYKLKTGTIDVFHPTYYDSYFLEYIGDIPFVLTIHDMIHEKFSNMMSSQDQTSINKKLLAERASKIIAISESTKRDIIDILGVESSKIDVIYHGNSMIPSDQLCTLKDLPSKYILFVGNRATYKNFNRFIKAISSLLQDNTDLHVVCAGGGVFSEEEKNILSEWNIDEKVHQYNIDDNTLSKLYQQAIVFVFPSMYEGFGIPILEAFACDCPLACSNTSSLPEVAGDAAVYFDPMDKVSIKTAITTVLDDSELRKELVQAGRERLKLFSWKKTAQETKKVYRSVLNG